MEVLSNPILLQNLLFTGFSGGSAVIFQSSLLIWAQNLVKKQRIMKHSLVKCAKKIIQKDGIISLFKGFFPLMLYNSLARFGDVSSNFLIINFFNNHEHFKQTPIFIQSAFSWIFAAGNRILLTPIQIYSKTQNYSSIGSVNKGFIYQRVYQKQIKPQIKILYFWLMVQNYLVEYTQKTLYKEQFLFTWSKYVGIGFCSMISYDIFKKIKDKIIGNSISSKYWLNRALLRGVNGSIFCSTSRFIKQKITE